MQYLFNLAGYSHFFNCNQFRNFKRQPTRSLKFENCINPCARHNVFQHKPMCQTHGLLCNFAQYQSFPSPLRQRLPLDSNF